MSTLILGCRPTLPNVEAEVTAIAATAPGAELLLDPTADQAGQRAPHHTWCHFAGHADPKLGPDRVLVLCHNGGFAAVEASTLVAMLRTMKLVVLNGCISKELGLKLREARVLAAHRARHLPAASARAVRYARTPVLYSRAPCALATPPLPTHGIPRLRLVILPKACADDGRLSGGAAARGASAAQRGCRSTSSITGS